MLISCQATRWLSTLPQSRLATILVSLDCRNNCLFCGAADQRRNRQCGTVDSKIVEAWLRHCAAAGVRLVAFSGAGDPLTHPDFLSFIETAVDLGMHPYAYTQAHCLQPRMVEIMVNNGLQEIAVSVHGANARSHEQATQQPGSFDRTLRGLRILLDGGLRVQTNSVVTRLNATETESLVDLLAGELGVHDMAFSYPRMEGNARAHRELFLSYAEAAHVIRPALARVRSMGKDATVENVPLCYLTTEEYTRLPDYEVMYKDEYHDLCVRPSQVEMHYLSDCEGCQRRPDCTGVDCGYPLSFTAGPHREPHTPVPETNLADMN